MLSDRFQDQSLLRYFEYVASNVRVMLRNKAFVHYFEEDSSGKYSNKKQTDKVIAVFFFFFPCYLLDDKEGTQNFGRTEENLVGKLINSALMFPVKPFQV